MCIVYHQIREETIELNLIQTLIEGCQYIRIVQWPDRLSIEFVLQFKWNHSKVVPIDINSLLVSLVPVPLQCIDLIDMSLIVSLVVLVDVKGEHKRVDYVEELPIRCLWLLLEGQFGVDIFQFDHPFDSTPTVILAFIIQHYHLTSDHSDLIELYGLQIDLVLLLIEHVDFEYFDVFAGGVEEVNTDEGVDEFVI